MADLPLRPNVCMFVINSAKAIFLGERLGEPGVWQLPQGGAEPSLSLEQNVLKELEEEIGVDRKLLKIVRQLNATHEYEFKKPRKYGRTIWRGQAQTFWLVEFLGHDSDIDLDRDKPEFMDWSWCSLEELRRKAEKKRLPGYEKALKEVEEFLLVSKK